MASACQHPNHNWSLLNKAIPCSCRPVGHQPMSETISDLSDATHFMCATVFPPLQMPPSPPPLTRCAGCFFYVSDFLDYWIENLFTFVRIYLCPAQSGHGLALDSPRTDARTLSLLLIVYPSFTLPLSLSLSYCYLSSSRRQCKIFWHKVNSIFDYYLNRFLSHWARQCSVPSSRRCYSSRCCCCCRSYAHACDMSYSCLFTEPTRNAAHKRDLKEKI